MKEYCFDREKTKGRDKLILNEEGLIVVEELAEFQCIDEEIAGFLGVSVDTLLNKTNKENFLAAKKQGVTKGKASLRRMQWRAAQKGNVPMLIWLGKQYLGQKEVQEVDYDGKGVNITVMPASKGLKKDECIS